MITPVVRRLEPGDAERLSTLFRGLVADAETRANFHPHPLDDENARRVSGYKGRDLHLGCFVDDRLVGYGLLRGWDDGYEIPSFGVAVSPTERGLGAGSALLAECIRLARDRGATILMLKVHPENVRARDWYLASGFEIVSTAPDGQLVCHFRL